MICLNMIVKNESKVIRRCLESVKDVVDYYVISDTGSTDNTKEIIREVLGDNGRIIDTPWNKPYFDFGYHREVALHEAYKSDCDYAFIMDADFELSHYKFENLTADSYSLNIRHGVVEYPLRLLLSLKKEWHWHMPRHNYLSGNGRLEKLNATVISHVGQGAKSQGKSSKSKFLEDATILLDYLGEHPNDSRTTFYIAQSYKHAGEHKMAKDWYLKRIEMGGWKTEVHWSLLEAARCEYNITKTFPWEMFLKAYQYDTTKPEALYEMVHYCRVNGFYQAGYSLGVPLPMEDGTLFKQSEIYDWKLLDDFAVCAYRVGQYELADKIWASLLGENKLPKSEIERTENNRKWAQTHLTKQAGYYDGIYKVPYDTTRYNEIYKQVGKWAEGKVLDIGCGTAPLIWYIEDYSGFDFSEEAIKQASCSNVWVGDAFTENLEGYDTYVLLEVLEHVDDLKLWERIPEGNVIFSVPSFSDPAHLRTYDEEMVKTRFLGLDIEQIIRFNWDNGWCKRQDTPSYILLVKGKKG